MVPARRVDASDDLLNRAASGRLPAARLTARDAALVIAASDAHDNICIAALRSAVDCDPSAAMRTRLELLSRDRKARQVLRTDAGSLLSFTEWRD